MTTDSNVSFHITYSSENTVNILSYVIFSFAYKFVFGPLKEKNNVVAIHFVSHKKNIKKFPFAQRKQLDDLYYKQDQELLDSIVPETEEEVKLIIGKAAIPEFTLCFFANGFCRFRFEKLKISLKTFSKIFKLLYIVSRVFQMKW